MNVREYAVASARSPAAIRIMVLMVLQSAESSRILFQGWSRSAVVGSCYQAEAGSGFWWQWFVGSLIFADVFDRAVVSVMGSPVFPLLVEPLDVLIELRTSPGADRWCRPGVPGSLLWSRARGRKPAANPGAWRRPGSLASARRCPGENGQRRR